MKKQSGFSAIEAVMAVVIIALIGVVAWQAVKGHQKAISSTSPTPNASAAPSSTPSQAYLKVPELGVKLSLSDPIKDAYYDIQNVDGQPIAYMSLHSLDAIDSACAADKSSTAALSYFTDPNEQDMGGTMGENHPNAAKINGKYFFVELGNGPCTFKPAYNSVIDKIRKAFSEATISAL